MKSQVYDTVKSKQKVAFQSRFRDGRTLSRTGGIFFFFHISMSFSSESKRQAASKWLFFLL